MPYSRQACTLSLTRNFIPLIRYERTEFSELIWENITATHIIHVHIKSSLVVKQFVDSRVLLWLKSECDQWGTYIIKYTHVHSISISLLYQRHISQATGHGKAVWYYNWWEPILSTPKAWHLLSWGCTLQENSMPIDWLAPPALLSLSLSRYPPFVQSILNQPRLINI